MMALLSLILPSSPKMVVPLSDGHEGGGGIKEVHENEREDDDIAGRVGEDFAHQTPESVAGDHAFLTFREQTIEEDVLEAIDAPMRDKSTQGKAL
jgi:hypothetical protein